MSDSRRFGRYEVEEEVARGGMGVIYRVRDPEMRRFLAMKVLLSEGGDADPAISGGGRTGEAGATDLDGNVRTDSWSIGAYEYDG